MDRYNFKQLQALLNRVEKPGRYTGGELNSRQVKDNSLRFALTYPDMYEVGMSNHGLQILYDALNRIDQVSCERVFAPAYDFFTQLKDHQLSLYTLESLTPLKNLDVVGFNLSHELLYTNLLYILDAADIPLKSCERSDSDPIIIAGGEAVSNPAPISQFVDLVFAGEGEEGIVDIAKILLQNRNKSKQVQLDALALVEGVFIPSRVKTKKNRDDLLVYTGAKTLKRRAEKNVLTNPLKPVVPTMRTSQDRAVIEITRGCDNLCKFCHAGYYTLPYRQCDVDKTVSDALTILDNTGYDGVTFSSLSISDYQNLIPLINQVLPELNRRGVGMNLPSMKVDSGTLPLIESISRVKRVNLTFAVESAHTEIRKLIHKRVYLDELLEIVTYIFNNGWKTIKLYFMLGLPGYKEYDEADSIIELLHKVNAIGKGKKSINVTVSPFIPKPHTPFDMVEMAPPEYFFSVVEKLKRALPKKIAVKNHNINSSYVEGFLSRGDNSVSDALYEAYKAGCSFDSWSEYFKADKWLPIIEKYNIENRYYSERVDNEQSWSIIDTGYSTLVESKRSQVLTDEELKKKRMKNDFVLDTKAIDESMVDFEQRYEKSQTVRLIFSKLGRSQYISHLDLVETIKRAFHIVKLPLCYSRGFNKREKISAGFPLPLGIESICEAFDLDLYAAMPEYAFETINKSLPDGVALRSITSFDDKSRQLSMNNATKYSLTGELSLLKKVEAGCLSDKTIAKKSKKGQLEIAVKQAVHSMQLEGETLELVLYNGVTNALRIDVIIDSLLINHERSTLQIVKSGVYTTTDSGELRSLLDE